jgi:hypothetical protein
MNNVIEFRTKPKRAQRIDITQDELLHFMQNDLDFTPEQIEMNRRHGAGQLFLSEDVTDGLIDCGGFEGAFEVGVTVCATTGELIESKVTRELEALEQAFDDLVDEAVAKFRNRRDPDHAKAMESFLTYVRGRSIVIGAIRGSGVAV